MLRHSSRFELPVSAAILILNSEKDTRVFLEFWIMSLRQRLSRECPIKLDSELSARLMSSVVIVIFAHDKSLANVEIALLLVSLIISKIIVNCMGAESLSLLLTLGNCKHEIRPDIEFTFKSDIASMCLNNMLTDR